MDSTVLHNSRGSFTALPEDIGRLIFQTTAALDPEAGRSCALVSREINRWYVRCSLLNAIVAALSDLFEG